MDYDELHNEACGRREIIFGNVEGQSCKAGRWRQPSTERGKMESEERRGGGVRGDKNHQFCKRSTGGAPKTHWHRSGTVGQCQQNPIHIFKFSFRILLK
ncbi:unnamed protein product [Cuscuta campestris]|uniref:Uncharacterized protein n=1 Tax=Cuscuta campestris TaxID=132261 RepID=A0A484MHI8_9ASTE|nr:unnamed protein product [Cuscuta campestris]